jgi:hypothetical protein
MGEVFTTPKDLRHLAEQHFGQLFVPVDVLTKTAHRIAVELRLDGHGRVVVHGERARHWHPFRIARVEAAREPLRIAG